MSQEVIINIAEGILNLNLNRPTKKNALTQSMYLELDLALKESINNPEVKVVLLTGSEGNFTSGNDLKEFLQNNKPEDLKPVLYFLKTIAHYPKPIIAAVSGVAIGIGTTVLLHCDLVYAAANTHFQLPFVPLGLCPEAGSSYLLPRLVGSLRSNELLLLAKTFDATYALNAGLINQILPTDQFLAHAQGVAKQISQQSSEAIIATKALLKAGSNKIIDSIMEEEAKVFVERLKSKDAQKMFMQFFQPK
jgi:enoyl-CoA hydratase/carnithine racemase